VGNQAFIGSLGMDFDVVTPIRITQLGVFDDGSNGLSRQLTARIYNRDTQTAVATLTFATGQTGTLIGGSRFLSLAEPLVLDQGFQGSIVIWYSNGTDERLFNTFGNPDPAIADLQVFDGGSIFFVGAGRYGSAGRFPGTVDSGPVNRYAGATFAFEPVALVSERPVIQFVRNGDKLKLTWPGGGFLETVGTLGGTWQSLPGAASGIELTITGNSAFYRVRF